MGHFCVRVYLIPRIYLSPAAAQHSGLEFFKETALDIHAINARIIACGGIALLAAACGGGGGYGGGGSTSYIVGGTVSGLASGDSLVLQDNHANNTLITANGSFAFSAPLSYGMAYNVTVLTQPSAPLQTCAVANATGTIAYANVTNVAVSCL